MNNCNDKVILDLSNGTRYCKFRKFVVYFNNYEQFVIIYILYRLLHNLYEIKNDLLKIDDFIYIKVSRNNEPEGSPMSDIQLLGLLHQLSLCDKYDKYKLKIDKNMIYNIIWRK